MADPVKSLTHDGSMVLVYLSTKLGHKNGANVGKYSSTMDPVGVILIHNGFLRWIWNMLDMIYD